MRMFDAIISPYENVYSDMRGEVDKHIDWARKTLKKNDAIVWYLRWLRINIVHGLLLEESKNLGSEKELTPKYLRIEKLFKRLIVKLYPGGDSRLWNEASELAKRTVSHRGRNHFEHFMSLDIPKIKDFQWDLQRPGTVIMQFQKWEEEWNKKFDGLIPIEDDDQVIMEFDGGTKAWVFLDRSECDLESKAMGHCGNAGGDESGRILSFRSRVDVDGKMMWEPHLTFILDTETNELGEMKGKGNDKPSKKYHPYIVALLESQELKATTTESLTEPGVYADAYGDELFVDEVEKEIDITIQGLRGGGYLPEHNFRLSDLEPDIQDALIEKKPGLASMKYQYRKFGMTKELAAKVIDVLELHKTKWIEGKGFLIDEFGDSDEFKRIVDYLSGFDARGLSVAEWAANVLSYDEMLDYDYIDDDAIISIYENLPTKEKTKLDIALRERNPDWADQGLLDIIREGADDEVYDALKFGYYDGVEVGTRNEIYKDFVSWLKDAGIVYSDGWKHILNESEAVAIATAMNEQEESDFNESWQEHNEFKDLNQPYNGWQEYDEKVAIERAVELLYENGIVNNDRHEKARTMRRGEVPQ